MQNPSDLEDIAFDSNDLPTTQIEVVRYLGHQIQRMVAMTRLEPPEDEIAQQALAELQSLEERLSARQARTILRNHSGPNSDLEEALTHLGRHKEIREGVIADLGHVDSIIDNVGYPKQNPLDLASDAAPIDEYADDLEKLAGAARREADDEEQSPDPNESDDEDDESADSLGDLFG